MSYYSKQEIDEIWGVKQLSDAHNIGTVLFETKTDEKTYEQLCRTEDGRYYLTVKPTDGMRYISLEYYENEGPVACRFPR